MALNLPVFYKRTASAIVFGAIMLAGLLWNPLAFFVLVCLVNTLCLRDYFRLMQQIDKDAYWPESLPLAIQILSLLVIPACLSAGHIRLFSGVTSFAVWGMLFIAPALLLLFSALPQRHFIKAALQAFGGLFYITMPMVMLFLMQMQNFILPIALILMIWSNDTFAYLVGSFIGKRPLSGISPKKTWEGTVGGALLTVAGAVIYGYFSHKFTMADWIALALCATVAGTFGDLLESKLKRLANVKDSGNLMPGHGGALDRFDSLLVATPFAFVYVIYFM
jgi:phosphatidate cytidylyltransferase